MSVGISLYAALVIIQVASTAGISTARRKLNRLSARVKKERKTNFFSTIRALDLTLQSAEIDIDHLNSTLIKCVGTWIFLLLIPLSFFSLSKNIYVELGTAITIFAIYLGGPALILIISGLCMKQAFKSFWKEFDEASLKLSNQE